MNRSELMSRIRPVSALEVRAKAQASELAGCRLSHQPSGLCGKPDYANKTRKVAVFVDGCFWHVCPLHFSMPKTNRAFWRAKFSRNVARRRQVCAALRRQGWKVLRLWEHEVRRPLRKSCTTLGTR